MYLIRRFYCQAYVEHHLARQTHQIARLIGVTVAEFSAVLATGNGDQATHQTRCQYGLGFFTAEHIRNLYSSSLVRSGPNLSTMRSKVRFRKQSVRPFSPSSTSRPQGTQGNIMDGDGPSLRRRPGYPGERGMDGEGGWGP